MKPSERIKARARQLASDNDLFAASAVVTTDDIAQAILEYLDEQDAEAERVDTEPDRGNG